VATRVGAEIRFSGSRTFGQYTGVDANRVRVSRNGDKVSLVFDGDPGPYKLDIARLTLPAGAAIAVARLLAAVTEGYISNAERKL
jgi:hypothetical protein